MRINPPALSPSRNATTFDFDSQSDFIDSSIFAPSIASAFSNPARRRFITSARPSTSIIQGESKTPEPHASFSFPKVVSLPADVTSDTSFSISSPSLIVFVDHFWTISRALSTISFFLAVRTSSIASSLNVA